MRAKSAWLMYAREVILCRAFCVVVDNRNGMAEHCVGLRLEIISRISIGTKYFCCFDVGKLFVKFVQAFQIRHVYTFFKIMW